jgi:bifunctional UDP-N-acetylglucosamine pyrophosphorylase/glucosamine-1-phosphate N-acetyltransferase
MNFERTLSIILCAGNGNRMNSDCPKVLNTIAGKTMIQHVLETVQNVGIVNKIIVTNPSNDDQIRKNTDYDVGIKYVIQDIPLGTGHAVQIAKDSIPPDTGNILLLFGDVPLIDTNTLKEISKVLENSDICIISFNKENPYGYGRVLTDSENRVISIVEEADASVEIKSIKNCFSGLIAFKNVKILSLVDLLDNNNIQNEYYLTQIISLAAERKLKISNVVSDYKNFHGVNTQSDLALAENYMQDKLRKLAMDAGVKLTSPETTFMSSDTIFGKNIVIEPNVYIGLGVEIKDNVTIKAFSYIEGAVIENGAIIGPFARIREKTIIGNGSKVGNFVEIKNSNISENVKISHLSYIGDTNIGNDTNIGAGTITCNYDGVSKHQTNIGSDVFVGSNTSLVAPLTIEDDSYIASGSVINKDVPSGSLAITRVKQENKINWSKKLKKKK